MTWQAARECNLVAERSTTKAIRMLVARLEAARNLNKSRGNRSEENPPRYTMYGIGVGATMDKDPYAPP